MLDRFDRATPLLAPGDLPVLRAERAYRHGLVRDAASPPSRTAHRAHNHGLGHGSGAKRGETEMY